MEGARYIALAVAVVLLAALPYAPWVEFSQSRHIDPDKATEDEHLPTQDNDEDGLPDWWEIMYNLNPFDASDAHEDSDWDGIDLNRDGELNEEERYTNLEEYRDETYPKQTLDLTEQGLVAADSDGDGMPDGWEAHYGLDPLTDIDADRDWDMSTTHGDGLTNLEEYLNSTDPFNTDTDGDGMPDGWEVQYGYKKYENGLSPTFRPDGKLDPDNDGWDYDRDGDINSTERYTNLDEFLNQTHPFEPDTDGDLMVDGWEVAYGLRPLDPNDADFDLDDDGLLNKYEFNTSSYFDVTETDDITDSLPNNNDTDGDGLLDGREAKKLHTDWTDFDTDGDGMDDGWEALYDLEPLDPNDGLDDPDSDGWDFDRNGWIDIDENFTNREEYDAHIFLFELDIDSTQKHLEARRLHANITNTFAANGYPLDNEAFLTRINNGNWKVIDEENLRTYRIERQTTVFGEDALNISIRVYAHTNPQLNDTDFDLMFDGWEHFYNLDPMDPDDAEDDPDRDGWWGWNFSGLQPSPEHERFTNLQEFTNNTNPRYNDTDFDLMFDGWELHYGLNPTNRRDADYDSDWDGHDYNGSGVIESPEQHPNFLEFEDRSDPWDFDTDGDKLPDGWEHRYGLNSTDPSDNLTDFDDDGLTNVYEYNNSATQSGYLEVDGVTTTDPLDNDTDDDGLLDGPELLIHGTDPTSPDTDGDGMPDGWEVLYGLDPTNATDADGDLDRDGFDGNWDGELTFEENFTNLEEYLNNTDPTRIDSDGDSMNDGWEAYWNDNRPRWAMRANLTFNLTDASDGMYDFDNDSLVNVYEFNNSWVEDFVDTDGIYSSSPWANDTDDDLILDGEETVVGIDGYITDPTNPDSDLDGMPDGWENLYGLDPFDASDADDDLDDDGHDFDLSGSINQTERFTNLEEYLNGTDPTEPDSDGDLLPDGWEVGYGLNATNTTGENGALGDPDGDGFDGDGDGVIAGEERWYNLKEYRNYTDPRSPDSDGDELDDGWEAFYGYDPADWDSDDDDTSDGDEDPDNDGWDLDGSGAIGENETFPNRLEALFGADPLNNDTDADGLPDGWEALQGLDPTNATGVNGPDGDPDNDGFDSNHDGSVDGEERFTNREELEEGTDPSDPDSDEDGMNDGFEAYYS